MLLLRCDTIYASHGIDTICEVERVCSALLAYPKVLDLLPQIVRVVLAPKELFFHVPQLLEVFFLEYPVLLFLVGDQFLGLLEPG